MRLRTNFQIQVLSSLFFRNKGAYIVGKVINGSKPAVLPSHSAQLAAIASISMPPCLVKMTCWPCSALLVRTSWST